MNRHALEVLEFRRSWRDGRQGSERPGKGAGPGPEARHPPGPGPGRTSEGRGTRHFSGSAQGLVRSADIPMPVGLWSGLGLEGSVLEPKELFSLGQLSPRAGLLKEGLAKAHSELPSLGFLSGKASTGIGLLRRPSKRPWTGRVRFWIRPARSWAGSEAGSVGSMARWSRLWRSSWGLSRIVSWCRMHP